MVQGQTVSALTDGAIPGVTVRVGNGAAVTSDSQGFFDVDAGRAGAFQTTIRGAGIVERETAMAAPTNDRARVSLIPSSFDLAAFDEMFRTTNSRLQRWTSRPSLVVLAAVMSYRSGSGNEYQAEAEQLSDQEVTDMVAHMTEGLGMLTGGTYTSFESVEVERPAAGTRVNALRLGSIVVGRYNGIVSMVNTIGYGQWADQPNGAVSGGAMYLDRDFDKNDNRRRLLRIHELGHALGYQHVKSRTSIMNPVDWTRTDRLRPRRRHHRVPARARQSHAGRGSVERHAVGRRRRTESLVGAHHLQIAARDATTSNFQFPTPKHSQPIASALLGSWELEVGS